MKRVFILCLFVILFSSYFSGPWVINNGFDRNTLYDRPIPYIIHQSNNINMVLPTGSAAVLGADATTNKGKFTFWYENGKGNFSTNCRSETLMETSGNTTKYDPFMMASILYENPRRPPGTSTNITNSGSSTEKNNCDLLLPGKQIKLFQSVRRVVSTDPMVFAVSYQLNKKPEENAAYRIVLKYNHTPSAIAEIFNPLRNNTDSIDIPTIAEMAENSYELNSNKIPSVRTFASEQTAFHTASARMLGNNTLKASATVPGDIPPKDLNPIWERLVFSNAVVINNLTGDNGIHNLYISLTPSLLDPVTVAEKQPQVFLEAVLQQNKTKNQTEDNWTDVESSRIQDVASDAHDPNEVVLMPNCFTLPQKATTLHTRILFQNTGQGNADSVIIKFIAPPQTNLNSLKIKEVTCGNQTFTEGDTAGLLSHYQDTHVPGKVFVFRVLGTLSGTSVNNPSFNPLTMGSIDLEMQLAPGQDINKPEEIKAVADIFFHSENGGNPDNNIDTVTARTKQYPIETVGFEQPVTTDTARAFYRETCNGSSDTPHQGSWLCKWWWLLVILVILLIFVLWYFFMRRRQNQNAP